MSLVAERAMALTRTALVALVVAAAAPACDAAFRGKHFDHATALHTLGKAALQALEDDQKEGHCRTTDPKRCRELCQGKDACMGVCNEVRSMICSPTGYQVAAVSAGDTSAAAAAAAASASSAVQSSVKDAIKDVAASARHASDDARKAIKDGIAKIQEVSMSAAHLAASEAAAAAAKAATYEAAASAHTVASTAAVAAVAAATAAGAPRGGAAPAPAAGPAPAPAF